MARLRNYRISVLGTGPEGEDVRYVMYVYGVTNAAAAKAKIRSDEFRKSVLRKYHTSIDHPSLQIAECNSAGRVYGESTADA